MPRFNYGFIGSVKQRFHLLPETGGLQTLCGKTVKVGPDPKRPRGALCRTCRLTAEVRGWRQE